MRRWHCAHFNIPAEKADKRAERTAARDQKSHTGGEHQSIASVPEVTVNFKRSRSCILVSGETGDPRALYHKGPVPEQGQMWSTWTLWKSLQSSTALLKAAGTIAAEHADQGLCTVSHHYLQTHRNPFHKITMEELAFVRILSITSNRCNNNVLHFCRANITMYFPPNWQSSVNTEPCIPEHAQWHLPNIHATSQMWYGFIRNILHLCPVQWRNRYPNAPACTYRLY